MIVSARIHDNFAASRLLSFCALSESGDLNYAIKLFNNTHVPNSFMWNTLIRAQASSPNPTEALFLYVKMRRLGVLPEKIHVYMEDTGIEVGVILGTALVHMYAKNGAILMAWKCFDSMPRRNIATWNAMICGLAAHGYAKEALDLFQELEKEQVVPNDVTFVSACCHAGLLDFGREIFQSMKRFYEIEPKIEHYGCMVDLLGRGGRLLEAEQMIKRMVWKADVMIWGALLSACKNHGNIGIAERAVKKILALDPHNHGVYVVLSNMYAEAGQWADVSRLRKVIKEESLKKTPGLSLLDGD